MCHDAPVADREVGQLYDTAMKVIAPMFRFGWRITVDGIQNIPSEGGAIICPNQTSVLDSFFLPVALPRRITYVGKAEYMDDWKTRKLFPALGMIPIDRSGGNASERALNTAQGLIEQGELFGIYPEGTRSRNGKLYRGHTGPARLALRTGAPIIPVGIVGARDIMPPEAKFPKPFKDLKVRFGRPVDPARFRGRDSERMVLRQMIDEVMFEIRELSGQEYVNEYATKKAEAIPADTAHVAQARGISQNGDAPSSAAPPVEGAPGADGPPRTASDVLRSNAR